VSVVDRAEGTVRQLELAVTRRLDGLLYGDHQGLLPGPGSEAGDGRPYVAGDDVRRIDWNLTARSGEVHVRDEIADRELETWLVVDASASVDFGTARCEKRDLALAAAAAFGFLTARDGNRLAAIVYGPDGAQVVPPRSGRVAVQALLHTLDRRPRARAGDAHLADALRRLRGTARRRGVVVAISDLLDRSDWPTELRALATRHDVVVCELRDRREDQLPAVGLLTLIDPETGRRREVQTANARLRQRYAEAAADRRREIQRAVRASGASHLVLDTDRDWMLDIVRYVTTRRRARR
jgi:uncharacterized protein (DUF58 family)